MTVDVRAVFDGEDPADDRPMIFTNNRQMGAIIHDATTALAAHNQPPTLFQRGGQLVRLRKDEGGYPIIEAIRPDHMKLHLAHAATWWRRGKDAHTATSPPLEVAQAILAAHEWGLPALAGVVELPVLRPDGTFHVDHGYDEPTMLYHWHAPGTEYEKIRPAPSLEQLDEAVALIDEMLAEFPWDTTADRANAWALLITPFVRPLITNVPMALIDAPEPGTGKSLLVRMITTVTTGREAPMMPWPESDEEMEKKITSVLMAGQTNVIFDNVDKPIKSHNLAAVLTSSAWGGRILGRSEMVMVPNRATWIATGNNIDVGGDLARRCYRIRLDARQAQPYTRDGFRYNLDEWVPTNRSRLVHALCTIVRSWVVAGKRPDDRIAAMGSFTAWARIIGGILEHAGIPGFLSNLAEFHRSADREAQQWEAFLSAWHDCYGENGVKVGEVVAYMEAGSSASADLKDAIPDDLIGHFGSSGFSRRLGQQLRKRTGRHYGPDGLHLVELPRDRSKVAIYSVTIRDDTVTEPATPPATPRATAQEEIF